MADHFYSKTAAVAEDRGDQLIVVATSSTSAAEIEVRVKDGTNLTRRQVYDALRHIADYITTRADVTNLTV